MIDAAREWWAHAGVAHAGVARDGLVRHAGLLVLLILALALVVRWTRVAAAPQPQGVDLHGLARLRLPAGFVWRGLDGADRQLAPAEQLARHDERRPLVFGFTRDAHNDWGGHARDPELLNVVLLPPAARQQPDTTLRRFSIARYFPPTGEAVPLDSPRWTEGQDGPYRWRLLALEDAFGADHAPRWALVMLDSARGVRLDYFVWQRRTRPDAARALLRQALDSLQAQPAWAALHQRGESPEQRLDQLRETRLHAVFQALAPLGLPAPASGQTVFAPGVAAWLDDDRRALRVMRVLASLPRPPGAAGATRDTSGRPRPGLVPWLTGDTGHGHDAARPLRPLQQLYWNPARTRWQISGLHRSTGREDDPLLPFEAAVAARVDRQPGARDAVHLLLQAHWYQPPVLDDARDIEPLLQDARRWQALLTAGPGTGHPGPAVTVGPAFLR